MPTAFMEPGMFSWDINTIAQVVIAAATVGGLWYAIRRENRRQNREQSTQREARLKKLEDSVGERLNQVEAGVENALKDQDTLTKQLHRENVTSIAGMSTDLTRFKDMIVEKIHQIELTLARAGITGRRRKDESKPDPD